MKNKTKRNLAIGTGVVLIANAALALTGCCDKPDNPPVVTPTEVKREFTITVNDKIVTIKDTRTGVDDEDLNELGVVSILGSALEEQTDLSADVLNNTLLGRGLVIIVEDTTEYVRFKAYSGNKMGANINYLLDNDGVVALRMSGAITAMANMEPGLAQVKNQNRMRYAGGMSPFELAQTKKHGYVRS